MNMKNIYAIESEPKSREDLRTIAKTIRKTFQLTNELYFPIVSILEILQFLVPNASFEVLSEENFKYDVHGLYDPDNITIKIREDVYERACNGEKRDRMTLAHEFAHFVLMSVEGIKFHRSFVKNVPRYKDPEWQAKCLAGELMIDSDLTRNMTAEEVSEKCGVSRDAAIFQCKINKGGSLLVKD